MSGLHNPIKWAAYFTGPGLDSINKAWCKLASLRLISWALSNSLFLHANCNSEHNLGATFAVTDIHPCPPWARKANEVPSSPER